MTHIIPSLQVLTPDQIEFVHRKSIELLQSSGVRVDSKRARAVFQRSGACSIDGDRVRIAAEAVNFAVAAAPEVIDIFDRSGKKRLQLAAGTAEPRFGIGVTNLYFESPQSNRIEPFRREHVAQACRLGETLPQFDVISTPGIIQNKSAGNPELIALLEMAANSSKPLVLLITGAEDFRKGLDLLQHLFGEIATKPFTIPYFNPVTPLILNEETSNKIFLTIEAGLPLIYSNYSMYGATTPMTPAGTLITLNAELLAGLVFIQLIKKGTPVILGSLPAAFEMQSMISTYTAQSLLLNAACAEMMAHYRLPHAGTSGSGNGWGADLSAAGSLWMNHLGACLGKTGLVPFVGGNFDSLVFSPATVVYANEIIRMARQFRAGFALDDATAGLTEIEKIGPGGNFLTSESTLAGFQQMMQQYSKLWPAHSLESWQAAGEPAAEEILRERTMNLLKNSPAPNDHDEIIAAGEAWIKNNLQP